MRNWINLVESHRVLYHGTLRDNLPNIDQNGLQATVGDFTSNFYDMSYDDDYEPENDSLEPLVFAAAKKDIARCVTAIRWRLQQMGLKPTPTNVIEHGAIVAMTDNDSYSDYGGWNHRPHDGETDYEDHPTQVEPGDFYSYEGQVPSKIFVGKKLATLLRRNRIEGFYSPRPPIRGQS